MSRSKDVRGRKRSKFTEQQIVALHRAYIADPSLSIHQIAKKIYREVGYASPMTAAVALSELWRARGWQVRGRIEQTVECSTGLLAARAEIRRLRARVAELEGQVSA